MFDSNKFYEILALLYYNTERTRLLENILKAFFGNPSQYFNINDAFEIEQKKELSDKKNRFLSENPIIKELFLQYDYMQTACPNNDKMFEYVRQRYGDFGDAFEKKYGIKLDVFLNIIDVLLNIIRDKALNNKLSMLPVYEFENKEEYADLHFLARPNEQYIKNLKEIITIDIDEVMLNSKINSKDMTCFLNLYSFDIDKIKSNNDLRFREFPIFFCKSRIVFINPVYCVRFLPQKIHNLLLDCKSYRSNKGHSFESIALETVNKIPNMKLLDTNIKYEKKR